MSEEHLHPHDLAGHNRSTKNIFIALLLNLGFAVFEIIIGIWTNSLAIISNALHDLGDSFSLGLSLFFEKVSRDKRSNTFSYGYKRFSVIPVIINSVVLLVGSVLIIYAAVNRIMNPQQIKPGGMIAFALIGMTVNFVAFVRLQKGKTLNEKAASLHLLDDVLGLLAVLIISIIMQFAYVPVLDPILSILLALYVVLKIFQNLKTANLIFLQAVPPEIDVEKLTCQLRQIEGVNNLHDLHAWTLDGISHIMTVHLVVRRDVTLEKARNIKCEAGRLIEDMGIGHPTIEIEVEGDECRLKAC
jgi:cobalt-zinc-cadmium efflux system protein